MNTLYFWNRIFQLPVQELIAFLNMLYGNSRIKYNISTLITPYIRAIVQQRTGSGDNQPSEVTGKVWCKSSAVPQL
jgi:hypothetical protein